MTIDRKTTFGEVLTYMRVFEMTEKQIEPLFEAARARAIPDDMRYDFNKLIFGKLAVIQNFSTAGQFFTEAPRIVLMKDKRRFEPRFVYDLRLWIWTRRLLKRNALEVFSFILDMKAQFERIAKLFKSIEHTPTREEERAGISDVRGSMHNIADWYAQRMGIQDVSSVYLIQWIFIFQAMKIDKQNNDVKRRLYEQANKIR